MTKLELKVQRSDRNIAKATKGIVAVLMVIVVLIVVTTIDANAQDIYSVSSQLEGQYLTGTEFSKLKTAESFTVTLNANKSYEVAFEGTNVKFTLDGVTFSGEFTSITMTTTKTTTIVIYVEPTDKKNQCGIAIAYLGDNE